MSNEAACLRFSFHSNLTFHRKAAKALTLAYCLYVDSIRCSSSCRFGSHPKLRLHDLKIKLCMFSYPHYKKEEHIDKERTRHKLQTRRKKKLYKKNGEIYWSIFKCFLISLCNGKWVQRRTLQSNKHRCQSHHSDHQKLSTIN